MAGTEIMFLVPHKGKLYVGNSLWMESDLNIPKTCQIFVLNSPDDDWEVDYQFSEANLRVSELKSITFSTDGKDIAFIQHEKNEFLFLNIFIIN
jgi:hypothetical protein